MPASNVLKNFPAQSASLNPHQKQSVSERKIQPHRENTIHSVEREPEGENTTGTRNATELRNLAPEDVVGARDGNESSEESRDLRDTRATKPIREITIDRNDIIMGLADIARGEVEPDTARVRLTALIVLANIFRLLPKNGAYPKNEFEGWTRD